MKLDPHTFGDSPAEITLAKILNELGDEKTSSYAARFLGQFNRRLKSIKDLDRGTRKFISTLMRAHAFEKIDKAFHFQEHPEVITYMKNCVTKRIRQQL